MKFCVCIWIRFLTLLCLSPPFLCLCLYLFLCLCLCPFLSLSLPLQYHLRDTKKKESRKNNPQRTNVPCHPSRSNTSICFSSHQKRSLRWTPNWVRNKPPKCCINNVVSSHLSAEFTAKSQAALPSVSVSEAECRKKSRGRGWNVPLLHIVENYAVCLPACLAPMSAWHPARKPDWLLVCDHACLPEKKISFRMQCGQARIVHVGSSATDEQ